ncbi:MAG: hypothetical protein KF788_17005 [Piscinibacter sp.]|nr:hypothetical protein [Piscinibacter sp.]
MGLLATLGLTPTAKLAAAAVSAAAAQPAAAGASAGTAAATPPSAADKNQAAYQTARAAIQKLVDALWAHPQKDHISFEAGQAAIKLGEADAQAALPDWKQARARLEEAKAICVAAKKLADDWAGYARRRATASSLIFTFKGADQGDWVTKLEATLAKADQAANATPPKFADALKELKKIEADTLPDLKDWLGTARERLKAAESAPPKVRAFLQGDIDQARPLVDGAAKALADGEFALAEQNRRAAMKILGPAVRSIERYAKFEKQRTATVAAIAPLRGKAGLEARVATLDQMVADADALAAPETLRIEEGLGKLVDAAAQAAPLAKLAPLRAAAMAERGSAEAELAALDQHAAAARLAPQRAAIAALLQEAATTATIADGAPDPLTGWTTVSTQLKRARADLTVAKKLADSLGAAAAAETAAANPADTKALQAALAKLRADGQAAAKAPHAAVAAAEFERLRTSAQEAEQALAAGDGATAATALAAAAAALAEAKTLQAGHAQFATTLAQVEAELKKLRASPRAKAIQPRLDAVQAALDDARAQDQAHAHPAAMAALRRATDAEAAARAADQARHHFDDRAAALAQRIAGLKDAAAKKTHGDALAEAKKLADALDFAAADKALGGVEIALDKARLEGLLKGKSPSAKDLSALADKLAREGGGAEVDTLIQGVPDNADPKLVNALAKGRYGVAFSTGKPLDAGGNETKAMKTVCDMFAKFPQDIRGNPSIRGISHEDKIPSAKGTGVGGGYYFDEGTIELSGRPGLAAQQFGANLKSKDPVSGLDVPQLPGAIDPKCQPANTDQVDFLAYAAAHEVGHGIDDQNGFMKRHQHLDEYGGWIVYGGSVQPLADIVAPHFGLDKSAELRQYVFDKLQSKPPARPLPADPAEDQAMKDFEAWHALATSKNIYRRQGDCDKIKIGDYIYHEAYTRQWVGYKAAARMKGLTGYQFRAPPEWFAELYAGYRSGKLGPDHPAREWLAKL